MQDAVAQWFGQTGVPTAKNGLSNNNKKKNEIISLSAKWATTNFWIISKIVHIKIYRSYLFFIVLTSCSWKWENVVLDARNFWTTAVNNSPRQMSRKPWEKRKNIYLKISIIFLQNKQPDINGSNKSGKRIATHQLKCQLVSSSTCT